jgi:hypothetical protein
LECSEAGAERLYIHSSYIEYEHGEAMHADRVCKNIKKGVLGMIHLPQHAQDRKSYQLLFFIQPRNAKSV